MFRSNWRSKINTQRSIDTHTQFKLSRFTWEHSISSRCPKPSNLHELWPGLHQASANSELVCHRHKDKWPYQCKVPNDWQVCGVWGGSCGQTHVVALDKPLWNERAHLWVHCGSGTSPPAERGNRLVCSSKAMKEVDSTTQPLSELDHDWQVYSSIQPASRMLFNYGFLAIIWSWLYHSGFRH